MKNLIAVVRAILSTPIFTDAELAGTCIACHRPVHDCDAAPCRALKADRATY